MTRSKYANIKIVFNIDDCYTKVKLIEQEIEEAAEKDREIVEVAEHLEGVQRELNDQNNKYTASFPHNRSKSSMPKWGWKSANGTFAG